MRLFAERRRRMLARHHLIEPAGTIERVAGDLVGLHSSDPATVYLSLRSRIAGFTVADFDAAMYHRRSLTRILGMRRTLFVVPLDLAAVIDAACTQALVSNERRRTDAKIVPTERVEPWSSCRDFPNRAAVDPSARPAG